MEKTSLVMIYEMKKALRRISFLFFAFGLPILVVIGFTVVKIVRGENTQAQTSTQPHQESKIESEGFIDLSGLVVEIPPDLPEGRLVRFPDQETARQALQAEKIAAYYVIPTDYMASGHYDYYLPEYNPISDESQEWVMNWALIYNLSGRDMEKAQLIWFPANLNVTNLSASIGSGGDCLTPGIACEGNAFLSYLPLLILVIFFLAIMMGSSLLLRNVSEEKENRVMEQLLVSASTRQLLIGKVVGLGILSLMQVVTWIGALAVVISTSGQTLKLPLGFSLPGSFMFWGLLFFLLGYAVYACLMAAAGALIPDLKSYSGASTTVASPLFLGYTATVILFRSPNGIPATILSLFPLTSPVVMPWRIVQQGAPAWQIGLSIALLALTVGFTVHAASRMFNASELLSGAPFQFRQYLKILWSSGRQPKVTSAD